MRYGLGGDHVSSRRVFRYMVSMDPSPLNDGGFVFGFVRGERGGR